MKKLFSTAVALAMALTALPAAAADGRASSPGAFATVLGGAQVSLDSHDFTAFALRLEAGMDLAQLDPKVGLGGVVSLGLWHVADEQSTTIPGFGTMSAESQASVFELVPAARVTFVPAPRFWLYADAGVGVGYTAAKGGFSMGGNAASMSDSGVSGVIHVAFGAMVVPTENIRLSVELVGLSFRRGLSSNREDLGPTYDFLLGVSHRL